MCQLTMESGVVCVGESPRAKNVPAAVQEVIQELFAREVDFISFPVILCMHGRWNWMLLTEEGRFAGFRSLGEKAGDKSEAIEYVRDLHTPRPKNKTEPRKTIN